jgi:DNA-binding response OmpR family regulator
MARILVIDDDDSLLQVLSLMLKRAGHEPILKNTARDGFESALKDHPDLLLVDVMMPEVNGFQLIQQLRKRDQTRGIPMIVLTALSGREHEEDAQDYGADGFISKPVSLEVLKEEMDKLLEKGPRNEAAASP